MTRCDSGSLSSFPYSHFRGFVKLCPDVRSLHGEEKWPFSITCLICLQADDDGRKLCPALASRAGSGLEAETRSELDRWPKDYSRLQNRPNHPPYHHHPRCINKLPRLV